jgi:hypothetical protein
MMSRSILALGAFLFAALTLTACDYGQRSVCAQAQVVQVQAAPVYAQAQVVVPQYAQVVVPTVASFAQVQYAAPVIVQKQVVVRQQAVYGGFSQRQFGGGGFGGRQRAFGGGFGSGGVINAVNNLVNSPAGTFALGAFVGNGFRFGR